MNRFCVVSIQLSQASLGVTVLKIEGGYVFRVRAEISRLIALVSSKKLSLCEARVFIASIEMRAIRDGAEAKKGKTKKSREVVPDYQNKEIKTLSKLSLRKISEAKKKLSNHFELFSENKGELPIPRRLIRFLAKCEKRSTFLTLLSYIERGVTLRNRSVKNAGSIKAGLIASKTGLSLRSVRLARKELLELGIITPDTTKYQRKLNRDGAYFTINLNWSPEKNAAQVIHRKGSGGAIKSPTAEKSVLSACIEGSIQGVDNLKISPSKIAPLPTKKCSEIAPPYRDPKTSKESRNQKTQSKASNTSGVFSKQLRQGRSPNLFDVQMEDLKSFDRTEILYEQAVKLKIIENSESNLLNFVGAAVRAKTCESREPVRVFVGIIRKKLWHHITQADEDRARTAINKYRFQDLNRNQSELYKLAA